MRHIRLSCAAFCAALLLAACSGPSAPTPSGPVTTPGIAGPTLPPSVPPGTASRTFVFASGVSASLQLQGYTQASQFVLYDNGMFALQYPGIPEYRGTYTESQGAVVFSWEAGSRAGPWGATGSLEGDRLTVRYNLIMQLSDFEDAVYALK